MKIYNTRALTRQQRFQNALLIGGVAAIGLGVVLGYVLRVVPIVFDLFYLALGYGVGYAIRTYGRGVQKRFSYLGAFYTLLALFIAECVRFAGVGGILNPGIWIGVFYYNVAGLSSISGIINLIFKVCAVVVGYEQSRIV